MKENIARRIPLLALSTCTLTFWCAHSGKSQNVIEEAIKELNSTNVQGYVQPFVNSMGANFNSGLYHSAAITELGFHVQFQIVAMGTLIGDAEKTYETLSPYDSTPVTTATLFGDQGAIVNGPGGATYQFPFGQVRTNIVPFTVPQLTIGNVLGTQVIVRYIPLPEIQEFPKTTHFGIGIRHSINQYLPSTPVDIAAGVFYQKLTIGEIMEANAFNIGTQVSKSFSLATLYGGLQYETSSLSLNYTSKTNSQVHLDVDGENKFRATAGVGLNLVILDLNADINVSKVTVVSAGLSFGF